MILSIIPLSNTVETVLMWASRWQLQNWPHWLESEDQNTCNKSGRRLCAFLWSSPGRVSSDQLIASPFARYRRSLPSVDVFPGEVEITKHSSVHKPKPLERVFSETPPASRSTEKHILAIGVGGVGPLVENYLMDPVMDPADTSSSHLTTPNGK